MKNISVLSATTSGIKDGVNFTPEELEKLAATAKGVPVLIDFDPAKEIGVALGGEVTEKGLVISASISVDATGKYLVPGYLIPEYRSISFGVTDSPQDDTLERI